MVMQIKAVIGVICAVMEVFSGFACDVAEGFCEGCRVGVSSGEVGLMVWTGFVVGVGIGFIVCVG